MYLRNSGFAPQRRQGGFIQGAILFALVIIAVVVAAFSLANRDNQNNADTEQARVNASFMLKVGNDLQSAVSRAIADGAPPSNVINDLTFTPTSASGKVGLFDPALRYLSAPSYPETALAPGITSVTYGWQSRVVSGVGSDDATAGTEAILTVGGLDPAVCARINTTANGTLVTASPPADVATAIGGTLLWREGCVGTGTYFRAVVTDAGTAAST
jgi:hypothetical protein